MNRVSATDVRREQRRGQCRSPIPPGLWPLGMKDPGLLGSSQCRAAKNDEHPERFELFRHIPWMMARTISPCRTQRLTWRLRPTSSLLLSKMLRLSVWINSVQTPASLASTGKARPSLLSTPASISTIPSLERMRTTTASPTGSSIRSIFPAPMMPTQTTSMATVQTWPALWLSGCHLYRHGSRLQHHCSQGIP